MSRKSLKKKNSKILRLKILLEDKEAAEEELDIGASELTQILKAYSTDITPSQKKKFNDFFFGMSDAAGSDNDKRTALNKTSIVLANNKEHLAPDSKTNNNHLPWVKKLYKQIVQRSHPDKYIDFPIQAIKEKYTRICMNAMIALKSNDIGLLLLCAYEVEIKVEEPSAAAYIDSSSNSYKKRIEAVSSLIGYQWYHLPDINRIYFLETYLKKLGFTFDKLKASEVIRNNRVKRRKPGTRPPKITRSIH